MDQSQEWRLAELEDELAALKEINRALISRVERSTDHAGGSFSLFESNIVLQQRIKERTHDLQQNKARLEAEIVEHKNTESALRKLQQHTRQIIDTALDAVIAFDRDWKIIDWNPRAESTFGFSAETALASLNVAALITQAGHAALHRCLAERPEQEERSVQALELLARHRDGHEFPVEVSVSVLKRDDGLPLFSAFIRDITERKLAEEARYRTLFDNSPVGLLEGDFSELKRGLALLGSQDAESLKKRLEDSPELLATCVSMLRIVDVNHATVKLAEAPSREYYLANYEEIFRKAEPKLFSEGVSALACGVSTAEIEAYMNTFEGRRIELLISLSIAPGYEESWAKVLISVQDLTERKRAEREKVQLEAQLQQAQKMDTIGTLAGGIAHDFNNMLTPIMGYAELLSDPVNSADETKEATDHIIAAAKRARDLVRQILTFSRQVEQELKPIQLEPCLREALELVRASLPSTVRMNVTLESLPCSVLADPTQIHQVLLNLCTNAYQAMETGEGLIEVTLRSTRVEADMAAAVPQLRPGRWACLTVKDNGCGIEPHLLNRIFEPFFTTKEVGKGTGMGLAVTHGIIRKHGGHISVESTRGKGTSLQVFFPLIEERLADELPGGSPAKRGSERILVVDDEPMVALTTCKQLEKLGYVVTMLTDSRQTLAAFSSAPDQFDLVITDQAMPNLPGHLLADELKRVRRDIPIVLLTGYSNLIDEPSAKSHGICQMLLKPVSVADLSAAVREALTPVTV